ncbi:hypothetical protein BW730_11470 [Tessaracoccus aquimaris]|uniref:HTH tetR-type domain-containing protein n=1 Tax=Tessaracoccus aquimaris TaxID=1332264 RepID=A0A1Q2CPH4_9ACTN|nr:TetR/AcrR family transcriptional regulator [Tessaracoccus aquimaris]AQP48012.1 hypothetical protein BW730_11470 [Tessaracoccus aquimaris]
MLPFAPLRAEDDDQGPRGKYRKTAKTRAKILEAALAVFSEFGFEAGTLRQVAELAGISQAGLLHHYPNKVALLSALLDKRDERAMEDTQDLGRGARHLLAAFDFARSNAETPFEIDLFAVLSAEATRPDHPANDYMRRRYRWVAGMMEESFTVLHDEGHLVGGIEPAEAASQLIALWDGLQIQWLLGVGEVNIADRLESFTNLLLTRPLAELAAPADSLL